MSRNSAYDLSGKTALVTGASRGIGAAIAKALGDAGATVVAHYGSDKEGAQGNLRGVPEERKVFIGCDLSVPGSARELWKNAISVVGKIDILVNNAAVNIETPLEGSHEQWDSGWEATMQVNVVEPASLVREAVAHFAAQWRRSAYLDVELVWPKRIITTKFVCLCRFQGGPSKAITAGTLATSSPAKEGVLRIHHGTLVERARSRESHC